MAIHPRWLGRVGCLFACCLVFNIPSLAISAALVLLAGRPCFAAGVSDMSSVPGEMALSRAQLPVGVYAVTFRLHLHGGERSVTPLAALAVNLPGYPKVIYQLITPINFDKAGAPQEFTYLFDNFAVQDVSATVSLMPNKAPAPTLSVEQIRIAPSRRVGVAKVWPGKILYRTNEAANGFIVAYNGTASPKSVKLRCALESDLAARRLLLEMPLTLAAGERREVPVAWNTGGEEYGFALAATLADADGRLVGKRREYFSVADNVWKVGMYQVCRGSRPPYPMGGGYPMDQLQKWEAAIAAELAKPVPPIYWPYSNFAEFYAWSPDDFFRMAPEEDYWYSGTGNYTESKRLLQVAIEWLHRRGMRAIAYFNPFSVGYGGEAALRQHPQWFVYNEDGTPAISCYLQHKLEDGAQFLPGDESYKHMADDGYALWLPVNIGIMDPIDAQVTQIVKATKMFHWDGIRCDNYGYTADGYDFSGKKIDYYDQKRHNMLEARAWAHLRDSVWERLGPNFAVGVNDDYLLNRMMSEWEEQCRKGQLLMQESPRGAAGSRWADHLKHYGETGKKVCALGGHPLTIGLDNQYPVDHLYLNVLTYAMRTHPFAWYHSEDLPLGDYAQFVTRYSALIWDIDRVKPLATPERTISVTGGGPVWWKDLACVRQSPAGKRQYVLHLINPPVQAEIYTDPTNKIPDPLRDIRVSVKLAPGETISHAYLLSAEPVTHQEDLTVAAGNGQASVTVPRLNFWSMLVLE